MPYDVTRLRTWVYATSTEGARSPLNCQFLDALLQRGSLVVKPGMTISMQETEEEGVSCIRLDFHLPRECHSNGVVSIPVLVPNGCVGTPMYPTDFIFYTLIENMIGWLAPIGRKDTLVHLYRSHLGQPIPRSYSSDWHALHNGFTSLISHLRHSSDPFPGLGQVSGTFGGIEVTQARTSLGDVSSDYVVTLVLSNGQRMSLFLPRKIAKLSRDFMFDWLEVQNEFSTRVR